MRRTKSKCWNHQIETMNKHILPQWYLKKLIKKQIPVYIYVWNYDKDKYVEKYMKQGINIKNKIFTTKNAWSDNIEISNLQQIDERLFKEYRELFILNPNEIYENHEKLFKFIEDFSNHYNVRALSISKKLPNEKILSNTYIESQRDYNILSDKSCMLGRHIVQRLKIKKPGLFPINDLNICKFKLNEYKEFNHLKFPINLTFFRISYDVMLIILTSVKQNNNLQKTWEDLKKQSFFYSYWKRQTLISSNYFISEQKISENQLIWLNEKHKMFLAWLKK